MFFSALISGAEVAFFSLKLKTLEDTDKEEISNSKLKSLGWQPLIDFEKGFQLSYDYYKLKGGKWNQ